MAKMQAVVLVVAQVTERPLELVYTDSDGVERTQRTTEKVYNFPKLENLRVVPLASNPESPERQLWLIEGEQEELVAQLDKVTPLTLEEAAELLKSWGQPGNAAALLHSFVPLFQPKKED